MYPQIDVTIEFLTNYQGIVPLEPAHPGDSGLDLYSTEYYDIEPGTWRRIPCGLRLAIPDGYEGQIRSRSGLALTQGLVVLNTPGTIDSGYRGEICVIAHNAHGLTPSIIDSARYSGTDMLWQLRDKTIRINPGMKIAQLVFCPVIRPRLVTGTVDPWETSRGSSGFGSTGV